MIEATAVETKTTRGRSLSSEQDSQEADDVVLLKDATAFPAFTPSDPTPLAHKQPTLGFSSNGSGANGSYRSYHPLQLDLGEESPVVVYSPLARLRALCCEASNVRALVVLFLFNTSFAVAQVVAATAANSLSMYGDSATMLLDSLTYTLNIYAECHKSTSVAASLRLELIATTFSILTLLGVTVFLMWDAAARLESVNRGQGVQADIMLEFSVANLVVDVVACVVFLSRITGERQEKEEMRARMERGGEEYEATGLNMCSAFIHLLADTLRTITVLTSSILVEEVEEVNSFKADAISSLIVSTTILIVTFFLMYETVQQYKRYKQLRP